MKLSACLFVNGRLVGQLEYELPKDDKGREIPCPHPEQANEAAVRIDGPDGSMWFGVVKLEKW